MCFSAVASWSWWETFLFRFRWCWWWCSIFHKTIRKTDSFIIHPANNNNNTFPFSLFRFICHRWYLMGSFLSFISFFCVCVECEQTTFKYIKILGANSNHLIYMASSHNITSYTKQICNSILNESKRLLCKV